MFDDLKISELPNLLITPSAGDLLPIVNNSETKNSTFANLSKRNFIATSVNRIITIEDQIIFANAAAGNILLTLPAPSIATRGLIYYFKKIDSTANSVTISGGTYLIDSATTFILNAQNQTLGIFCDGAKYQILTKEIIFNSLTQSFETINKNLSAYPAQLNYNQAGDLSTIVFTLPSGTITKTFNYTSGDLTSIVLSGSTPSGINLTKSFAYTNGNLTGVSYS